MIKKGKKKKKRVRVGHSSLNGSAAKQIAPNESTIKSSAFDLTESSFMRDSRSNIFDSDRKVNLASKWLKQDDNEPPLEMEFESAHDEEEKKWW